MTVREAIAEAILRVRPDTKPHDAMRIAGNCAAGIRSELRWLDIYEDKTALEYEETGNAR